MADKDVRLHSPVSYTCRAIQALFLQPKWLHAENRNNLPAKQHQPDHKWQCAESASSCRGRSKSLCCVRAPISPITSNELVKLLPRSILLAHQPDRSASRVPAAVPGSFTAHGTCPGGHVRAPCSGRHGQLNLIQSDPSPISTTVKPGQVNFASSVSAVLWRCGGR